MSVFGFSRSEADHPEGKGQGEERAEPGPSLQQLAHHRSVRIIRSHCAAFRVSERIMLKEV